jgi:hypothetical protein
MGLLKKQADCNISNQEWVKNHDPFYRPGFLEGKSFVDIYGQDNIRQGNYIIKTFFCGWPQAAMGV